MNNRVQPLPGEAVPPPRTRKGCERFHLDLAFIRSLFILHLYPINWPDCETLRPARSSDAGSSSPSGPPSSSESERKASAHTTRSILPSLNQRTFRLHNCPQLVPPGILPYIPEPAATAASRLTPGPCWNFRASACRPSSALAYSWRNVT